MKFDFIVLPKKLLLPVLILSVALIFGSGIFMVGINRSSLRSMMDSKGEALIDFIGKLSADYFIIFDFGDFENFVAALESDPEIEIAAFYNADRKPLTRNAETLEKNSSLIVYESDIKDRHGNLLGYIKLGLNRASLSRSLHINIIIITVSIIVTLLLLLIGISLAGVNRQLEQDIERRRKTEEELKRFKFISDYSNEGRYLVDRDGRFLYVNDAACRMMQYARDELLKLRVSDVDELYDEKKYHELFDAVQSAQVPPFETINRRKDGSTYPVDISVTALEISGRPHLFAVTRDISERKQAEKELTAFNKRLEKSNRELQDFAYVASHDLQEPLRKVTTFGDRLKSKYASLLGEQGKDYLERMQVAARRMQTLIDGLLDYSRVTTKAKPFAPANLTTITREVLSDLEVRIEKMGAKFELNDLPTIEADPIQMRQLLQNLIGNALKFNKKDEPPVVRVHGKFSDGSGQAEGENVYQLTVEDNGIGFDEQYAERIFGVFQRLHGRDEYEGTGIGLSVCKKIAERHGGSIEAKSKSGEGAKFIVSLPVKQTRGEKNDNV